MKRIMAGLALAFSTVGACASAFADRPAPGAKAPDFALPSSAGGTFKLSDTNARQTVVLAFFPKAFTGG